MSYLRDYILNARYFNTNENDFEQVIERVSKAISNNNDEYEQYKELMRNKQFLPGGRTLASAGTNKKIVPNCVVLDVEDDFINIFDVLKRSAILQKYGSGIGYNFSKLRPANFDCGESKGLASGPISFMAVYSAAFNVVKSNGRHGANMGILNIDHPDILSFIHIKNDLKKLTNFNLSILVTEKFMYNLKTNPDSMMKCVFNNKIYNPRFVTMDDNYKIVDVSELSITYKELWYEIVESAYKTGDPGLIYERNMNKDNLLRDFVGNINATNPCVVAGTKVLTNKGNVNIEEHIGETLKVWNGNKFTPAIFRITGRNKNIYKVILNDGKSLTCTENHKFLVKNNDNNYDKKELKDCKIGDILYNNIHTKIVKGTNIIENAYEKGYFSGVGFKNNNENYIYVNNKISRKINESNLSSNNSTYSSYDFDIDFVPLYDYSLNHILKWLAGLFDSIGFYYKNKLILKREILIKDYDENDNNKFISNVQLLLQSIGIDSNLCDNYITIDTFYVNLLVSIGLECKCLNIKNINSKYLNDKTIYIKEIIDLEKQADKVYCVTTLDNSHTATFNGIVTGNCGEIGMYPNECCNLGSLNLEEFCDEINDNKNALEHIYFDKIYNCTKIAINFLDSVIDKMDIPDEKLSNFVRATRRLGLGVMGVADLFIKLKIPYGSELSRIVLSKIFETMRKAAEEKSVELIEKNGTVLKRLLDYKYITIDKHFYDSINKNSKIKKMVETYTDDSNSDDRCILKINDLTTLSNIFYSDLNKKSNISLLCVAPNGSTSMIFNVCGGIEPYFSLAYKRRINNQLRDEIIMNKHLEKYLKNNNLYTPEILEKIIDNDIDSIKEIPENIKSIFKTSNNINPEDHLLIQSTAQHHVDNSISKTCNLPCTAVLSDVNDIYLKAYDLHIKGITIYVDGCRMNQVLNSASEKSTLSKENCRSGSCDL